MLVMEEESSWRRVDGSQYQIELEAPTPIPMDDGGITVGSSDAEHHCHTRQ
jgi:hypothetical protein